MSGSIKPIKKAAKIYRNDASMLKITNITLQLWHMVAIVLPIAASMKQVFCCGNLLYESNWSSMILTIC